jgi:phosphoribosylformylglycinamidine cyclo-ligase
MTTYAQAGVDIDAADRFVEMIKRLIRENWPEVEGEIGGFAGGGPVPPGAVKVEGSTDGTGTVAILSALVGNYLGIGQNAVAMGAVDMYVSGSRPLYLLDTFNVGRLEPEKHIGIIKSVVNGCRVAGCKLIGGETAELPDMFKYSWMFNLDVAVIGFPDPELVFVPMRSGQLVYGWPSGGPGSNGFSLLRKVHNLRLQEDGFRGLMRKFFRLEGSMSRVLDNLIKPRPELAGGRSLADALLQPTPIWIEKIESERKRGVKFAGHAHITGGGMPGNIPRILPNDLEVIIEKNDITRPAIFRLTQEVGGISNEEMDRVFNNGVMVASIVEPDGPLPDSPAFQIGMVRGRGAKKGKLNPQVQFAGKYRDI